MNCSDLTGTAGAAPSPTWIFSIAVLWLASLRVVTAKRASPQRRAIGRAFLFTTVAATIGGYSARRAFDAAVGVPDLSILVGHVFAVLAVLACLELLAAVTGGARLTLRRAVVVLAS